MGVAYHLRGRKILIVHTFFAFYKPLHNRKKFLLRIDFLFHDIRAKFRNVSKDRNLAPPSIVLECNLKLQSAMDSPLSSMDVRAEGTVATFKG